MKPSIIRIEKIKAGTRLRADDGFTCLKEGAVRIARQNYKGDLFVRCSEGTHLLDGQYCSPGEHGVDFEHYIGFYLV